MADSWLQALTAYPNNGLAAWQAKPAVQGVNPFAPVQEPKEQPKVAQGQIKAEKWTDGLSGVPAGMALGYNAINVKGLGGKEGKAGARLNVDAFDTFGTKCRV